MQSRRPKKPIDRNKVMLIIYGLIGSIIGIRLFVLQVVEGNYYRAIAAKEHAGYTELPARRGEIYIKDYHNGDIFRIATNTTLSLFYADPTLVKNPQKVVDTFAPLLFDEKEAQELDRERLNEISKKLDPTLTEEDKKKALTPKTLEEMQKQFRDDMFTKITAVGRSTIILGTQIDAAVIEKIQKRGLTGINARDGQVVLYPEKIPNIDAIASILADDLDMSTAQIIKIVNTKNRYVVLKKKIDPTISQQMKDILKKDRTKSSEGEKLYAGVNLQEEYYRFYPEGSLAANMVGYVNNLGNGLYGIEGRFNTQLKGKNGIFQTKKDSIGRQITVGESLIQPAVNGDDIVLTIDRSIQMELDQLLAQTTKNTGALGGQAIIIDPKTGKILAMSHYPTFDPNNYGTVFEKEIVNFKPEEIENLKVVDEKAGQYSLLINKETGEKILVFKETKLDGTTIYKKYKNNMGPEAYQNKIVGWDYEPGSVFKAIAMSAAIDDKDVTPQTMFNDIGPVKTDEYEIKNATGKYFGLINMKTVLEKSLNTGMAFVARKMGKNLFYNYIKRYGFGTLTDIEFDDEHTGKIKPYTQWAESELITYTFGQGLTVTPIQMVNSYAAIANNGLMMQPYIVEEIRQKDGKVIKTEPHAVQQVISQETAQIMKAMLTSAVENGVAQHAGVEGHYLAAKTGTAQTYYKGKPLLGAGTTIVNIVGFGPIDDPKFTILIKLDKPKQSEWADATAAPMFSKLAAFLFDYFNIPPDKKGGGSSGPVGVE
ncbi:MAG: penicillin-binding protein 2 [Patescibacteria group bacterium]